MECRGGGMERIMRCAEEMTREMEKNSGPRSSSATSTGLSPPLRTTISSSPSPRPRAVSSTTSTRYASAFPYWRDALSLPLSSSSRPDRRGLPTLRCSSAAGGGGGGDVPFRLDHHHPRSPLASPPMERERSDPL